MKAARAIIQALALTVAAIVVALIHNAASPNGIDPLRQPTGVPVIDMRGDLPYAEEAAPREGIHYIALDDFRALLDAGDPVIDARSAADFRQGHIPGAILCDYYEMGRYIGNILPVLVPDGRIGLYCSGPLCDDAERLARQLYTMGYTNLYVFRGGIEEWTEEGLPLDTGPGRFPW